MRFRTGGRPKAFTARNVDNGQSVRNLLSINGSTATSFTIWLQCNFRGWKSLGKKWIVAIGQMNECGQWTNECHDKTMCNGPNEMEREYGWSAIVTNQILFLLLGGVSALEALKSWREEKKKLSSKCENDTLDSHRLANRRPNRHCLRNCYLRNHNAKFTRAFIIEKSLCHNRTTEWINTTHWSGSIAPNTYPQCHTSPLNTLTQ